MKFIVWILMAGVVLITASHCPAAEDRPTLDREGFVVPETEPGAAHAALLHEPMMSPNMHPRIFEEESLTPRTIFFQSGFEEDWTFGAPPGWKGTTPNSDSSWHRNDYTTGWSNALGYVTAYTWSFMGGYSARFHTASTPAGRHGFMTTPDIDLSSATDSVFLSFWWTNSNALSTMLDSLKVFVSTDGGVTFPIYLGFVGPTGNPWFRAMAYIPSQSANTCIKFQANSDGTTTDILLDEVVVFEKGPPYSGALSLPSTFSSFTDAARRLTLFGVNGPTTVEVASGIYADSVTLPPIPGATGVNTISFKSIGGQSTVRRSGVQTASTTTVGQTVQRTDDATISLWGADYLTFDGIGISDLPGTTQTEWGYYIRAYIPTDGASNNTIKNCTIVLNQTNSNTMGILHTTFWVLTADAGSSSRNRYLNNTIRSCAFRGIALIGYVPYLDVDNEIGSAPGGIFSVSDIGGPNISPSAVQISSQRRVAVHGVRMDSLQVISTSLPAIFVGGSAAIADSVVEFEIFDNYIHNIINTGTDVNGVLSAVRIGFSSTNPATAFRGRVYNNMVFDFRSTGTRPDGVIAFYQQGTNNTFVEWYNNTVMLDNMSTGVGGGHFVFRVNSGFASVRNNVFVYRSSVSGIGTNYLYYKFGGTMISSKNALFIDTTLADRFIGLDGGLNYRSLPAWQSSAPGRDTLSVFENPHFINSSFLPYDLSIDTTFNTQLESGGLIIPGVAHDIDGQPRYPDPGAPVNHLFPPTAPDIGADEFGGIPLDVAPPAILYISLGNTTSTLNRLLSGVAISDPSGINVETGTQPRLYYKKTGNANTFVDNTMATDGWKYAQAADPSSPFSFTMNYSILFSSGAVAVGDTLQYFVVVQDLTSPPNVGINSGIFNALPSSVALTPSAFPISGSINRFIITPNTFSGTYNVGNGKSFPSLTGMGGLFDALNGGVVTSNINVNITSDLTETGNYALNRLSEEGAGGYSLTIRPSGGLRAVSGNKNGALVEFNGTVRISVDGDLSGVKSLRFRNESSGTLATTFTLSGDAADNLIANCIIEGAGTGDSVGTIFFGIGITGDSGNIISNNDVRDRSDTTGIPTNAFFSRSELNHSNTISNNRVYNWTASSIILPASGAGNRWNISSNSLYQTSPRNTRLRAIVVESGGGHTIANNSIGGSAADRSGSPLTTNFGAPNIHAFQGIVLSVATDSTTAVSANMIGNIHSINTVGYGPQAITVNAGNVNIANNTIGGAANPWDTVRAVNHVLGAIHSAGSGTVFITNNTIGNIRTRDSLLYGIFVSGSGVFTISYNTVRDLATSSTTGPLRGIYILNPGTVVERNILHDLRNLSTGTSPAITVSGIYVGSAGSSPAITLIRRNRLYALTASGTGLGANAPRVWGIYAEGQNTVSCYNNMVAMGTGVAGDVRITGIEEAGSAANTWYYNSVSIGGLHAVAGTNSTLSFLRSGSGRDSLRDNIFSNSRTRGNKAHVAITSTSAANWGSGTSNYNIFFASNPDSVARWLTASYSLIGWRGVSGGDVSSVFGDPLFVSATDLHIRTDQPSPAAHIGVPIAEIATDFDGNQRDPLTPDAGAHEFSPPVSVGETGKGLPASFDLQQNYPNPFNPVTVFRYQIAESRWVRLIVYDLLGREIAGLVNEVKQPGVYSVEWNGSSLSSGVYFYTLRAGTFSETKKLMLLK